MSALASDCLSSRSGLEVGWASLLVMLMVATPAAPLETDGLPSAAAVSSSSRWRASVRADRTLVVSSEGGEQSAVHSDSDVLPGLAFSPVEDLLVYSRWNTDTDADLMIVMVPPAGPAVQLTHWPGSETNPVFSPNGRFVAFVSGHTGVHSIFVLSVLQVDARPRQITNVGLEQAQRVPGVAPEGYVPPPDSGGLHWKGRRITWSSDGVEYAVEVKH